MYDVIVVGGGTSGLMASVSAAQQGANVLLLEKNKELGRKLLLTGGGRCNITNNRPAEEIVAHIPGNGRFLYSAFSQFDNYDIIAFFKENGVALKEEDHGRMFPTSNRARTILDTFITLLKKNHITVQTNAPVADILLDQDVLIGVCLQDGTTITAKSVILALGGKSIPRTGSTGDGYRFAKKAGHTITPLFPTEVPLTSSEPFIKDKTLQGLSLRDISLSVLNAKGKAVVTHQMDMIFTHFGISGPAVLRCSGFVYQQQVKTDNQTVTMQLDVLPNLTIQQVSQILKQSIKKSPDKEIKTILKELLPERLVLFYLQQANISNTLLVKSLNDKHWDSITHLLKDFRFTVDGSLPIEKSFVTGGGVSIKEIIPQTMGSKIVPNLFFCGELLDIHGYTGGYNITSAFVTGYVAGYHAALLSQY